MAADAEDGWHLNDPEHLVVSGSGGGFLHPTHVFSYSRFRPAHDPAAGSVFLRQPAGAGGGGGGGGGGEGRPTATAGCIGSACLQMVIAAACMHGCWPSSAWVQDQLTWHCIELQAGVPPAAAAAGECVSAGPAVPASTHCLTRTMTTPAQWRGRLVGPEAARAAGRWAGSTAAAAPSPRQRRCAAGWRIALAAACSITESERRVGTIPRLTWAEHNSSEEGVRPSPA